MLDEKMDDKFIEKHGKPVKHMESDQYTYYRIKNNIIAIDKKNNKITRIMFSKKTETKEGIKLKILLYAHLVPECIHFCFNVQFK